MSTLTTPDSLYVPTGTDSVAPLNTVLANMQNSVQNALKTRGGAAVGSSAARDAVFPSPTQNNSVYRTDLGYSEIYYASYNGTSNPGGATTAGWYPSPTALIRGKATRTTAFSVPNASARTAVTLGLDTSFTRGVQASGTAGLIAPASGEYLVRGRWTWAANSTNNRLHGFFINGSEWADGVSDTRLGIGTSATSVTIMERIFLNAGDVITLGAGQNSGGALALNVGTDITIWWAHAA